MFIELKHEEGGTLAESLFKTPSDILDPALYQQGVVLGLVVPETGTGDFAVIQKVEDGQVQLLGLTSPRKGVYKVVELAAVRPQLLITVPKAGIYAVEQGAIYQDAESGLCYEMQDHCWRQVGQSAWATLPFLPEMILRDSSGKA
jgi:hypothetical protein